METGPRALAAISFALGAACTLGPARAHAQSWVSIGVQTSLGIDCAEPGCDCTLNGADDICGVSYLHNTDSGHVSAPAVDSDVANGTGVFVGIDSHAAANIDAHGSADFGTFKAYGLAHGDSTGTYVDAGGLAIPSTTSSYVVLGMEDAIYPVGPGGTGPVSLSFTQAISSFDLADVGRGGLAIDPCLANGQATTHLEATLSATVVAPSLGDSGLVQYARSTQTKPCNPPIVVGSPTMSFTIVANTGDRVNIDQGLFIDVHAQNGAGPIVATRTLSADGVVDASSTGHLYVQVLTAGATYSSASGIVYEVPEADASSGIATALASLLAARMRRRR
jgi:hypothetical protein